MSIHGSLTEPSCSELLVLEHALSTVASLRCLLKQFMSASERVANENDSILAGTECNRNYVG